jgi:hypothetical protein
MSEAKIPEVVAVEFRCAEPRGLRASARTLRKLGAKRSGDVVYLPRADSVERWQSDAVAHVSFHLKGAEQFLDDEAWEKLVLEYPVASLPAEHAEAFVDFVQRVGAAFDLAPTLDGRPLDPGALQRALTAAIAELRQRDLEPGSKELRIAIEAQYG